MFKNTQTLNWWTDGWIGLDWIYLRTLLLLEHLAVLKKTRIDNNKKMKKEFKECKDKKTEIQKVKDQNQSLKL